MVIVTNPTSMDFSTGDLTLRLRMELSGSTGKAFITLWRPKWKSNHSEWRHCIEQLLFLTPVVAVRQRHRLVVYTLLLPVSFQTAAFDATRSLFVISKEIEWVTISQLSGGEVFSPSNIFVLNLNIMCTYKLYLYGNKQSNWNCFPMSIALGCVSTSWVTT